MRTTLYVIWFLIPAFFLLMALWGKLEEIGNPDRKHNPKDMLRQGAFVLGCALVAVFIDRMFLESLVASLSPEWIPLAWYQIALLPFVLVVGAKLVGPSQDIRIIKAPSSKRPRRR